MTKSPAGFHENDPLYRITSAVGRIVGTGLLWCLCSLPVFTAGAASCAALAEFSDRDHRSPHPLCRTFLQNFRRCFRRATPLWLIVCAMVLLLTLDLSFYRRVPIRAAWGRYALVTALLVLADLALGVVRFAFYLLAEGSRAPLTDLLGQAGRRALLQPASWAGMLLIDLGAVGFFFSVPYFLFLLPALPGAMAWLHCGLIACRREGDAR